MPDDQAGFKAISDFVTFSDPDGDTLTITASSSDQSVIRVNSVNNTQISIDALKLGASTLTFTASDGQGGIVSHDVLVNVLPSKVVIATGSITGATAGNNKITGLTVGKKYVVTQGTDFYGVLANGLLGTTKTTLSDAEAEAIALTGTEITGLTNGTTYKVTQVLLTPPSVNATNTNLGGQWGFSFVDNPDWRSKITVIGYSHPNVSNGAFLDRTSYFNNFSTPGVLPGDTSYPNENGLSGTRFTWTIKATGYKDVTIHVTLTN